MRPITFTCEATVPLATGAIAGQILDVDGWTTFAGYGPLPGIASAAFEVRTAGVVGSRIRVRNTDGSSHVEETWTFEPAAGGTRAVRAFELHPRSAVARPLLWAVSLLLRRAVARHLRGLRPVGRAAPV